MEQYNQEKERVIIDGAGGCPKVRYSHTPAARALKPLNAAVRIIKALFIIIAVLLIINSFIALARVPFNVGSILPGALGLIIIGFITFIKPVFLFLRTKAGRVIGWVCGAITGVNVVLFSFFIIMTLTRGSVNPGYAPGAVIVLGAGLSGDRVTITLAARLDTAFTYYSNHPGVLIVVSGGQGPNETVTEASAMAKYLIARGVNSNDIALEARSSNTEENFAFSKAMLTDIFKDRPFKTLYVTNQFHIYRASLYAKKASLTAEGLAAPTLPRYLVPNNYSREYFALIKYWLFRR